MSSLFQWGLSAPPISKIGIEVTDSPYVVCNMHLMTRVSYQDSGNAFYG